MALTGAALGGLLDLTLLFRENLVPGGGDPLLGHQKDAAAHIDAQAATQLQFSLTWTFITFPPFRARMPGGGGYARS